MDGSGYPYHLDRSTLSLEARIIAVADVFQALAQKRPYRDPLRPNEIMNILNEQADDGKLDRDVVNSVDRQLQACWEVAISAQQV